MLKNKQMPRRVIQYLLGLVCMAFGLVLLKRTYWGISPISAVPDAVANITPLTLGNTTILLHLICVVAQIIILRRVTVKALLTAFVGIPFGYLVDLVMLIVPPFQTVPVKLVFLLIGIAVQGLGVLAIVCSDLMLPAPDELNHAINEHFNIPLSKVKVTADAIYVIIAIIINLTSAFVSGGGTGFLADVQQSGIGTAIVGLLTAKYLASVGIATFAAVMLTGRFIGWWGKALPQLKMEPFWKRK